MNDLVAGLLAWLVDYSYPVVGLTVLVSALGVPLPSTVVVLAAGGIAADGDPSPWLLALVVVLAAVAGDLACFTAARSGGGRLLQRWGPRVGLPPDRVGGIERHLNRWGGVLVVVTRCLLTGLALPTNLVAGAGGYPWPRFFLYAAIGETIWASGLMALGWWYGANWVALLDYVSDAFAALTAVGVAVILVVVLVKVLRAKPREPASAKTIEEARS